MFRAAVLALCLGAASAFVAPRAAPASSALKSTYENEIGVLPPIGFFDPLGLSTDLTPEIFEQYRTAELKHGRVAQLAVIGYIAPEIFRWPGEIAYGLKFEDIPNGVAAIDAIPAFGWVQMAFAIGAVDFYGFLGDFEEGKKTVGEDSLEVLQTKELQHGRLAMIAILELLRHDSQNFVSPGFDGMAPMITGLPFIYN